MPVIQIDAPVLGWDAHHSPDDMDPRSALAMRNVVPMSGYVETRGGSVAIATGMTADVETLVPYNGKLIAGANGKLYTVTTGGTKVEIDTGLTNDRWQTAIFQDKLIMCNGADAEQTWDGSTIVALDFTGSPVAITAGDFIGVHIFKGRAYYWSGSEASFFYCAAGSYQGVCTEFPVDTVASEGGAVKFITSMTMDAGDGVDDMMAIVMDTGQVLVYQGDDPGNLDYFNLVGVYKMGQPLSVRGHCQYGSDQVILTRDGYVNLSTVLQEGRVSDTPAFSRGISRAARGTAAAYAGQYGWECFLYPGRGWFMVNIPLGLSGGNYYFEQYVLNTDTGAWTRFTDWNAPTFAVLDEVLYFGTTDGRVMKADYGNEEDGSATQYGFIPAYQHLNPNQECHLTACRIISTHPDSSLIELSAYRDYENPGLSDTSYSAYGVPGVPDAPSGGTTSWANLVDARSSMIWDAVTTDGVAVTVGVEFAIEDNLGGNNLDENFSVKFQGMSYRFRTMGTQ